MIAVTFVGRDGVRRTVAARIGDTLLAVGQADGQPLEGTCGGQMACATCHVHVDAAHADRLPPPSEEEEDMLDLVPDATRYSRLACQIVLRPEEDGIEARIPA